MSEAAVTDESQGSGGHATEEEIEKLRSDNAELQQEIADAQSQRAVMEADHARDIEYGQLLTENTRLKAQLADAEAAADAAAVAEGSSNLMATIRQGLEDAVAQSKAGSGPVDTNSGYVEDPANLPSAADQAAAQADDAPTAPPVTTPTDQPADQAVVTDPATSPTAGTPTGTDADVTPSVPTPDAPPAVETPDSAVDQFLSTDSSVVPASPVEVPSTDTPSTDAAGDGTDQNEE